jgi:hypothetical protein
MIDRARNDLVEAWRPERRQRRRIYVWLPIILVWLPISWIVVLLTGVGLYPAISVFLAGAFAALTELAAIDVSLALARRPPLFFEPPQSLDSPWVPLITLLVGLLFGWIVWA